MLSNPPFGVEWKKIEKEIRKEAEQQGFNGRFGPGLPRVSDGSLLFLLHLISKMRPAKDGGSRFGIVLNGSPLFTGGAGSGESEIRRYVLENDLVEAIIGLPTDMFYNTGISTYVWIVSNRKPAAPQGQGAADRRQQLLAEDAQEPGQQAQGTQPRAHRGHHPAVRRVQGSHPRRRADQPHLQERGLRLPHDHRRAPRARRGGQDRARRTRAKAKASREPDANLRDTENVPLSEDVETYFKREVLPHAPDAWIDHEKTKVGYEIPFNRHFYVFKPPRPLAEIDAELKGVTDRILTMIGGLTK